MQLLGIAVIVLIVFQGFVLGLQDCGAGDDVCTCAEAWGEVRTVVEGRGPQWEFEEALHPLTLAVSNSYTWNNSTIPDWTLIDALGPPCGAHALAYRSSKSPKRLLIAVRGVQLGDPVGGTCDLCAFVSMTQYRPSYNVCSDLDPQQIDYFNQLKKFTWDLLQAENNTSLECLAFTGHSMGGFLASLLSMFTHGISQAFVFGSAGPHFAAKALGISGWDDGIVNLYKQYDPITEIPWSFSNQSGTGCLFKEKMEPEDCQLCYQNPDLDLTDLTTPCAQCLLQTHLFKFYEDAIFSSHKRPKCSDFTAPTSASPTVTKTYQLIWFSIMALLLGVYYNGELS